jgi:Flp pilus assembly protein TadG
MNSERRTTNDKRRECFWSSERRTTNGERRESGAVMVIAALMMVSLLTITALVVDTGMVYLTRVQLQKAADAAALAGAQTLALTAATDQAEASGAEYLAANIQNTLQPSFFTDLQQRRFTVKVGKTVEFFFAPIIGITQTVVRVNATAGTNVVTKIKNVVPFGVLEQVFVYGQQYTLKYGAGLDGSQYCGNFGALALGGGGVSVYRDNLKFGYQDELAMGDRVTTEPGNIALPTEVGVDYRINLCEHGCDYATQIEVNCPRVVIVPIIDVLPNGSGETTVKGFAAFFLEGTVRDVATGHQDVVGRFIRWAAVGETDSDANDYGVYAIQLME